MHFYGFFRPRKDSNFSSSVRKLVRENKLPHLLLYGPPGTGKTSTILTIAKEINGPNYQQMVLEVREHLFGP
jgi:DNA polymerase III delta prime subunit